ncbi:MAG TPA: ATP-dependent DNA helicase UvrD2 [Acidimicrobiia bacterium]|nr:ATP-dependent DNA helicase UvrD2 [Acidimicrobiia bacterium]
MAFPGPVELGRGVVVVSDRGIPDPMASTTITTIDDALLDDEQRLAKTVDVLHRLWASRTPHVVVLATDNDRLRRPEATDAPTWRLGADFTFLTDRLHFLVWANTWDARGDEPVWWWARKAERLGAVPSDEADVVLPDGTHAWIDAGPRGPLALSHVHAESIQSGRLELAPPVTSNPSSLSAAQLAAVDHGAGPARVIAPAGSGKTRTLTARLLELIDRRGYEPELVTALAYNNRAAAEMRDRIERPELQIRTFHSIGWAILREARPGVTLLDEAQVRSHLDRLLPGRRQVNTDTIGPYVEALSEVRIGLRTPEEVEADRDDVPDFPAIHRRYMQMLERGNAADHDEQISGAIAALLADAGLRDRWQRSCTHLLVDEFQDLTPAYLLLIRLLASPGLDVFGVGDDDQTIYGYAGADPGYLIGYDRLFPGASQYQLDVNYRCPAEVVESATNLLRNNARRIDKAIRPSRVADGSGFRAIEGTDDSLGLEAAAIVTALLEEGAEPGDVAVLARVNSALLPVHAALAEVGIPFQSPLGTSLLDRTVLRAVLAWMRLARAPESMTRRDLMEAVRRPHRRLNRMAWELLGRGRPMSLDEVVAAGRELDGRQGAAWDEFTADLRMAARAADRDDAARLLDLLIERVGLSRAATALDSGRSRADRSAQADDLVALRRAATIRPRLDGFEDWLGTVLRAPRTDAGVHLTTIHRVKGLEWPHIVVFGVERGLVPHSLSMDIEEERRVLHVAITRASESTTVVSPTGRPSPFLAEMRGEIATVERTVIARPRPATGMVVEAGMVVRVAGGFAGTVTAVDEDGVTVQLAPGPGELHVRWGDTVTTPAGTGPMVRHTAGVGPVDTALLVRLKEWRMETARTRSVPAYVVFSDATLEAIATARPRNELELSMVKGVGPAKLDSYADDILDLVSAD